MAQKGSNAPWGAVREAMLSECITAPLARMSLDTVRWPVRVQLEIVQREKDAFSLFDTLPAVGKWHLMAFSLYTTNSSSSVGGGPPTVSTRFTQFAHNG